MKKLFLLLFVAIGLAVSAANVAPDGESLNYRVMFKWGLINKQAGRVNMRVVYGDKGMFDAILTARTEKWADNIYQVRDTLLGTMSRTTCEPVIYQKITHEDGEFKHDLITYTRSGNSTVGQCTRRQKKSAKKPMTERFLTLESGGLTLDMLSSFYFMRSINYDSLEKDKTVTLTVFSGKRKETLTITYRGMVNVELDKKSYPAYHITFKFTGDGGKKTSDDMDAWISTDASRIPLKLEGKLPVGRVQCYLMP